MRSLLLAFILACAGCQTAYVPAADGRVSVIDLVMFPASYADQEVLTHGYLQWQDGVAHLYFDANHMARHSTRLVIGVEVATADQAEACAGREVLVRGVMTRGVDGWAIRTEDGIVC